MGSNSGRGMGPGQRNPGRPVFIGDVERFNTMAKVGRLLKGLKPYHKEAVRCTVSQMIAAGYHSSEEILAAVPMAVADIKKRPEYGSA